MTDYLEDEGTTPVQEKSRKKVEESQPMPAPRSIPVPTLKEVKLYYWGAPVDCNGRPITTEAQARILCQQSPTGRRAFAEDAVEIEIDGKRTKLR